MHDDLLPIAAIERFRPMGEEALSQDAERIGPALPTRGDSRALSRGVFSGRLPAVFREWQLLKRPLQRLEDERPGLRRQPRPQHEGSVPIVRPAQAPSVLLVRFPGERFGVPCAAISTDQLLHMLRRVMHVRPCPPAAVRSAQLMDAGW